jgi:hypothetical protein
MSTVKTSNFQSLTAGSPPVFKDLNGTEIGQLAKAWVNFNGTGTTSTNQTIRASFNVSSVFKNGTGDYTVNFATAFADANYSVALGAQGNQVSRNNSYIDIFPSASAGGYIPTASALRLRGVNGANAQDDVEVATVAIFR